MMFFFFFFFFINVWFLLFVELVLFGFIWFME